MREIKFRAKRQHWDEFDGWDEWLYANGYYFDGINYWFTLPDKDNSAIAWVKHIIIDPKTLGQYTGLPDKNGKEAYEGDLYYFSRYSTLPAEIYWDERWCGWRGRVNGEMQPDKTCDISR